MTDVQEPAQTEARTRVLYVDIEHAFRRDREAGAQEAHAQVVLEHARRVVAGASVERVWYGDLTEVGAAAPDVLALAISGNVSEWVWYDDPTIVVDGRAVGDTPPLAVLKALLRACPVPMVAFCGGHQLMAKAFSGDDGIVDHVDFQSKGLDRETEFDVTLPIQLTDGGRADAIFAGLAAPRFRLFHHDEVLRLPDQAVALASTPYTFFQGLRYDAGKRVIYTSQFHPEQDAAGETDGGTYLRNFFAAARSYWTPV